MQAEARVTRRNTAPYTDLTDNELLSVVQNGNDSAVEFLLEKYKNFVRIKARSYFLIGADREDLIQEGMIGLYKAIRDFRHDKQSSFRAFAELCITRQMITAIKTATRQKHIPLNSYVSLNKPMYYEEEGDRTLVDTLCGTEVTDPIDLVISGEELRSMRSSFGEILSELEAQVLRLYLDGKSYQEIAESLGRHVKSIDNALQRVKRKVELQLRRKNMC
ncbi:MAG: RNA polymerase sporulation sigma factor SigH [Actinobacteria bacterium]|nr:MAG: RNA polymerase sporulation sigma factor SigH [Actinomycetota bacterium]